MTRHSVRPSLLWLLVASMGLFGFFLHRNWSMVGNPIESNLQYRLGEWKSQRRFSQLLKNDPATGSRASNAEALQSSGERVQAVVFLGQPGSCCVKRLLDTIQNLRKAKLPATDLAVVLSGDNAEIRRSIEDSGMRPIIDRGDSLAQSFNAFWTPRAYVLRGGRFAWIQTERELDPDALVRRMQQLVVSGALP